VHLLRWLKIDRFDRRAANRELARGSTACGMRLRVQVVIEADDDDDDRRSPAVHEVAQIDRDALSVDTLGLHLAEAKHLLQNVQSFLID
jgi:hypothetical protein